MYRIHLFLLCFLCAACGFHPVHGVNKYQSTSVQSYMAATEIANIPDYEGQALRNHLIDRFHRGSVTHPQYVLKIDPIQENIRNLDITKTSDSTRAQLRLTTTMVLFDKQSNDIVLRQPLVAIVSYNILASEFSTRVSEKSARDNGIHELANKIENRVSLYFKKASSS